METTCALRKKFFAGLSSLFLLSLAGLGTAFAQTQPPAGTSPLRLTPQHKAWAILQGGMKVNNTGERSTAVRVLGLLPNSSRAVRLAEVALGDGKEEVRAAAATALGQMGAKASIPKLKTALEDKETAVVLAAAQSLLLLKDDEGYEVYYAVLTGKRKSGKGLLAEQVNLMKDPKKLAQLGFAEGIGFIPFAGLGYSAIKALTKDDVSPVRAASAKILANDPDPESGDALVAAASDKSWIVRAAALDAIAKRGDPSQLDGIVHAMDDEKEVVRYTAAAAVLRLSFLAKVKQTTK